MSSRRHLVGYFTVVGAFVALAVCIPTQAHILASVFAVIGVLALAYVDLRGIFVLAYPVVALIGALVSVSIVEGGAYMTEQWREGFNIGAAPLLGLYALGFLTVAHAAMTFYASRSKPVTISARPLVILVAALSIIVTLFYVIVFALYGFGLDHPTRFEWINTFPGFLQSGNSLIRSYVIPIIFAFAGIIWSSFGVRANAAWMWTTLLPILVLIGTGEKFSAYSTIICMVLTGVGIGGYLNGQRVVIRRRYLFVGAGLIVALAIAIGAGYKRMGAGELWTPVSQRIALQGHVWFGIYDEYRGTAGVNLLKLIRPNEHDAPSGLDLLSYIVSDPVFVYERIGRGISFTMGGPPGVLGAAGGFFGLIIYSALGLLYAAALILAMFFLRRNAGVLAAIPFGLYMLVNTATQMGFWDALYGPVAIAGYVALAIAIPLVLRRGASPDEPHPAPPIVTPARELG